MEATARRADYQRRVAGTANDFLGILAALVHVSNSQTAEGWDYSDVGVAPIDRELSDRSRSGCLFPAMIASNGTTRCRRLQGRGLLPVPSEHSPMPFRRKAGSEKTHSIGDLGLVPFR